MARIATHHTDLPAFAAHWPAAVVALVEARLQSDVAAADLRTMVLSLTRDRLSFGVWLGVEWEDFPYPQRMGASAGVVPLTPWLDALDEIARGAKRLDAVQGWHPRPLVRFRDPAINSSVETWTLELHRALVATAIQAATGPLATRFKQPVGVFISSEAESSHLVAFCHPQGAPLWPLREQRKEHGYGSSYPHGVLTSDGLTVFYPEGEGESMSGKGASATRVYLFDKMSRVELTEDEVHLRFEGEAFDVRFKAGHCHEERGGPDRNEVGAALIAHFQSSGRATPPGKTIPALPETSDALAKLLEAEGGEREQAAVVERLAKAHGAAKVVPLVSGLKLSRKAGPPVRRAVASVAVSRREFEAALAMLAPLAGEDRSPAYETPALIGLGRFDEALKLAKEDEYPERALALAKSGRAAEA